MNIKAIICFALLVGFHNRVIGSTNVTLVSTGTNTASFNVATNQVAKIVYVYLFTGAGNSLNISVPGLAFPNGYTYATLTALPIIVGPATISLTSGGGGYANFCTLELSTPADSFLPSSAVVIPSDSSGPVNIILESSADLINWYPSLPGAYGANYTNRFFRLRAQRTQ
jgi:hypothetical protein